MKKCLNCNSNVKETDTYCRKCGCLIESNKKYILINVIIGIIILSMIFMIALFIASYLVSK